MKTKSMGIRAFALVVIPFLSACSTVTATQPPQPTPTPLPLR
jgi:hypothetical protein